MVFLPVGHSWPPLCCLLVVTSDSHHENHSGFIVYSVPHLLWATVSGTCLEGRVRVGVCVWWVPAMHITSHFSVLANEK